MKQRERLLTALNCGIPDKVPTFDWFDEPVIYGVADILIEAETMINALG